MYCPSNVVFDSSRVMITLHTDGDYNYVRDVPLRQKANPLRYSICWKWWERSRAYYINRNGWAYIKITNAWWRIKVALRIVTPH